MIFDMNTTYRQDIWNYGTGMLRNCGEGFGGRTAVVALKNGFCHFLILLLIVVGVSEMI